MWYHPAAPRGRLPLKMVLDREKKVREDVKAVATFDAQLLSLLHSRRSLRAESIPRGRRGLEGSPNEGGDGHSSGTDGPSRKRRRSRKGLDKKFECPQEGCEKSYSRAEHLYRHQLNHTPKQIYKCDFPDCARTFVRQDLRKRHRDRHTAKGSQLHSGDGNSNVHSSLSTPLISPVANLRLISDTASVAPLPVTTLPLPPTSMGLMDGSAIGIIGTGDMGEMYARHVQAGQPAANPTPNSDSSLWGRIRNRVGQFRHKAVKIVLNGKECMARPDSGSDKDFMSEDFAKEHSIPIVPTKTDTITMGNGKTILAVGRAYTACELPGSIHENRCFYVLRKCVVPLILGVEFIRQTKLYTKNKHHLVECLSRIGSLPTLKYIGSPQSQISLNVDGRPLIGCADTGSDLDFMSLKCAVKHGFKIHQQESARTRIMLPDCSIVETIGQVYADSLKVPGCESVGMPLHILPGLPCDVVLGEDFLEHMDVFNKSLVRMEMEDRLYNFLTLINLGPIQALLSGKRQRSASPKEEHDHRIDAEHYRRYKTDRSIRNMAADQISPARELETRKRRLFDAEHQNCVHCVGANPREEHNGHQKENCSFQRTPADYISATSELEGKKRSVSHAAHQNCDHPVGRAILPANKMPSYLGAALSKTPSVSSFKSGTTG